MTLYTTGPVRMRRRRSADVRTFASGHDYIKNLVQQRIEHEGKGGLYWDNALKDLPSPDGLIDIDKAGAIIAEAVVSEHPILVFGDYDVDGITATTVCARSLKAFGHRGPIYIVTPDRIRHGYGLTPGLVDDLDKRAYLHGSAEDGDNHPFADSPPDALAQGVTLGPDNRLVAVTVDNGITAISGVEALKHHFQSLGAHIDVVVTDHHLPPGDGILPAADAIINPNREGDEFPGKGICGCAVAFYVMSKVRAMLLARGWFEQFGGQPPKMSQFLDLVAAATVCDMVPLSDPVNRILAHAGIARMNRGLRNPLINALIAIAGVEGPVTSQTLGFDVGPRINAVGRLTDPLIGLKGMLSDDPSAVSFAAERLNRINADRKQRQTDATLSAIQHLGVKSSDDPLVMVLRSDDIDISNQPHIEFHEGIVGLIASNIKQRWNRPVFVFTRVDGGWKGSGRSMPEVHIKHTMDAAINRIVSRWRKDNPEAPAPAFKYGGHAMAAGITIPVCPDERDPDRFFREFRAEMQHVVRERLGLGPEACGNDAYESAIPCDAWIDSIDAIDPALPYILESMQPWGAQFDEPRFASRVTIDSVRRLGKVMSDDPHVSLQVRFPDGTAARAIAFRLSLGGREIPFEPGQQADIVYSAQVNYFRGNRTTQLVIDAITPPGQRFSVVWADEPLGNCNGQTMSSGTDGVGNARAPERATESAASNPAREIPGVTPPRGRARNSKDKTSAGESPNP